MRLVPVYFRFGNHAIVEPKSRKAFQLPPVSFPEPFLKDRKVSNSVAGRDRLNVTDLTDDLEVFHGA